MVSESNELAVFSLSELSWTLTGAAAVAIKDVEPFTVPESALIVVVPAVTAVAIPELLMVATAVLDEDQVAVLVRSCILLSLKVPVALNCCPFPTVMDGLAGVTCIETRVGLFEVLWLPLPPPHANMDISRVTASTSARITCIEALRLVSFAFEEPEGCIFIYCSPEMLGSFLASGEGSRNQDPVENQYRGCDPAAHNEELN